MEEIGGVVEMEGQGPSPVALPGIAVEILKLNRKISEKRKVCKKEETDEREAPSNEDIKLSLIAPHETFYAEVHVARPDHWSVLV